MSSYEEILKTGEQTLRKGQIEDWRTDAWQLLEYVSGKTRAWFYAHGDEPMEEKMSEQYIELLNQRIAHVPLQHLTGQAYFMGLEFEVNEHVLIPRQDTEILVETMLLKLESGDRILDMCTGSGCILLSLLALSHKTSGTGCDLSSDALEVAKRNSTKLNVSADFIQGNLFENVQGIYDIIVSNPPYIPTEVITGLMPEVKEHEPYMALDGHGDGLFFYRKIAREAGNYLKDGGWIGLEIGYDQGESVKGLLEQAGYKKIEIIKDLAGLDRVVIGNKEEHRCLTD